ncbi:prephenate dehydrogenase/arogenate dehydrogenase family protein [Pelagicoccus sp. SDUM812002]|uniref:prephenate dehydrogenase n=1 Tax=Pelagicoccus sp. SDUM812002 TaxID=3041266 RepID=UPI00280F5828|nr:prephenate dehydrogenase/arogenate dehydrogenase family protein [Pelagicoccus sp. SDUM812002]MDQ8186890.1 prephenate dehydrogenase/arogenate dehydrogenase family protein [Pelagicoccus sp. SDUM812002]
MFQTITIVAPGLLGASLAIAASEKSVAKDISIWARRPEAVESLLQQPWCTRASTDLDEACRGSELIVLCAPVNRIITLAEEISKFAIGNPIVTDVGSVKADIVHRCEAALVGRAHFIGSHPMAGSEKTGMENACGDLFEQRVCFVTPSDKSNPEALAKTNAFWEAIGSLVVQETPDRHDEIVAQVSHLPHLLASSLATFLATRCPTAADYCGNGLRDTTRVASGSPELWHEIVDQNRPEVLRALRDFQDHLQSLTAAIANQSDFELLKQLADGKQFRDQL